MVQRLLAFETSTEAFSVALLTNGEIEEHFEIAPQRHAEKILPTIHRLLEQRGLIAAELDALAFGRGPGSFMGIRIATGIAHGLAFGAGCPTIPISTLATLAWPVAREHPKTAVLAVLDARMGEIYGGYFCFRSEHLEALSEEWLGDALDLPLLDREVIVVGCHLEEHRQKLEARLGSRLLLMSEAYPRASAVAELAFRQGRPVPPEKAQPVYLRQRVTHPPHPL